MGGMSARGATAAGVVEAMTAEGYCVVEGVLGPGEVAAARASLRGVLAATPRGRNSFEGFETQRVYALFAKTRAFDAAALPPLVLGVLDQVLGDYQLSAPAGIQ